MTTNITLNFTGSFMGYKLQPTEVENTHTLSRGNKVLLRLISENAYDVVAEVKDKGIYRPLTQQDLDKVPSVFLKIRDDFYSYLEASKTFPEETYPDSLDSNLVLSDFNNILSSLHRILLDIATLKEATKQVDAILNPDETYIVGLTYVTHAPYRKILGVVDYDFAFSQAIEFYTDVKKHIGADLKGVAILEKGFEWDLTAEDYVAFQNPKGVLA